MYGVNDLVVAVWVGVQYFGAAVNPRHGSAGVSGFACNIVGNIEGTVAVVHCNGSDGKPVFYSKRLP